MWKRHLSFSLSFGLIALLNLFSEMLNIAEAQLFTKPLICIFLSIYLVSKTKLYGVFSKLIVGGLVFSLTGDIALIFADKRETFFLIGLGAFLLAHVFYSLGFFRDYKYDPLASGKYGRIMFFIVGMFAFSFFIWIIPHIADIKIPVLVYTLAISIMAILAGYRYQRVSLPSFQFILIGAILFLISDTLLAINKFVLPFSYSGVFIMATYISAQYLITIGALERNIALKKDV